MSHHPLGRVRVGEDGQPGAVKARTGLGDTRDAKTHVVDLERRGGVDKERRCEAERGAAYIPPTDLKIGMFASLAT